MNNVQLSEMSKKISTKTKSKRGLYEIIMHNDNVNTFDHVINCLIDFCGHNQLQAHQCALITHKRGQCSIFIDYHDACSDVCKYLTKENITTTLIKFNNRYEVN